MGRAWMALCLAVGLTACGAPEGDPAPVTPAAAPVAAGEVAGNGPRIGVAPGGSAAEPQALLCLKPAFCTDADTCAASQGAIGHVACSVTPHGPLFCCTPRE